MAVVTDAGHNRLAEVPVTFTVTQGGGSFNGQPSVTLTTDSDGQALAVVIVGPTEGVENNVVEATFPGNPGVPASFVASGKTAGDSAATTLSGVVLDNSNNPIPGVTLRIEGTALVTQSDPAGQFLLHPAPVGQVKLIADGRTAQRPGVWPSLEYDLVTIAGQTNTIGMPIYLLPLDLPNGLLVDETHGGTLTLPQVPGFALTIAPGSATFPDGSRRGVVSVTVVHADKVPMVPTFGQQPRFIVTIQPAGTRFTPPAPITLPNVDGLAPGEVTELYSFDHDLGQFVSIGPGTVSEDGSVVRSAAGVGVLKGGWHCGGNPVTTGSCCDCPECQKCANNNCVADFNPATECCDVQSGKRPKHPIADLSKCPNRVAHPGHIPSSNGCGPAACPECFPDNINAITSPACALMGQAPSFKSPCNSHDLCYDTCNDDKSACDSQFSQNLKATCAGLSTFACKELNCELNASIYADAVEIAGAPAYESSQKNACDCCP